MQISAKKFRQVTNTNGTHNNMKFNSEKFELFKASKIEEPSEVEAG